MRPFSLKNHPDNVCVFAAESMIDALIQSDEAHRRGFDAGIWVNPGKALETPDRTRLELETLIPTCPPDIHPHFERATKLTHQYRREGYKMPAPGLDRELERRRFAGLFALRVAFKEVIPEGRCQMDADYAPHVDPEPNPDRPPKPEALFEGEHVKVLRAHNVAGTIGFDERDRRRFERLGPDEFTRSVRPKWYIAVGDIAIFKGHFLHSTVPFKLSEGQTPRAADIHDCSGGIPLQLARKLV